MEPSLALQSVVQALPQRQQVHRVLSGVFEHVLRQRTHRPVGALVLLVEPHAEEALEERGQPEGLDAEELGGDPGIEDVGDAPAVVLVEETQIIVGIVEDDLNLPRLEELAESRGRLDLQRIEDRVPAIGRELQQIDAVDVPVEARAFGVEGESADTGNRSQESVSGFGRIDV